MNADSSVIILEPDWCLLSLPGDLGADLHRDIAEDLEMPTVAG